MRKRLRKRKEIHPAVFYICFTDSFNFIFSQFKHPPLRLLLFFFLKNQQSLTGKSQLRLSVIQVQIQGDLSKDSSLFYSSLFYFKSSPCFVTASNKPTFLQPIKRIVNFSLDLEQALKSEAQSDEIKMQQDISSPSSRTSKNLFQDLKLKLKAQ